ncbi:MAG: HypC/HybG/HupF family hydrogenase formation chaperone [Bifidobacteriaceae bacterium]|jgi:hydrogenase maturation factor|nr:HypC/HybG/HupF family hydrogenase formation chaperone [Bifidobacteriaceae bacterium]
MSSPRPPECSGPACITCSDQATTAEIIDPPNQAWGDALVKTESGTEWIDVSLVGEVAPGDLVLVHAGTAIGRIDPGNAAAAPADRSVLPGREA